MDDPGWKHLAVLAEILLCVRLHALSPHARNSDQEEKQHTRSNKSTNDHLEAPMGFVLSLLQFGGGEIHRGPHGKCHNALSLLSRFSPPTRELRRAQSSSTPQTKLNHSISYCQTRGALNHNALISTCKQRGQMFNRSIYCAHYFKSARQDRNRPQDPSLPSRRKCAKLFQPLPWIAA